MSYYQEHPKFYVSTDCIIFGYFDNRLHVLIRPRAMQPGLGELSLMGGFVDDDESVDNAAKRIVEALTGLENFYIEQVGAFGAVDRDPGERVVSICYFVLIESDKYNGDAQWCPIDEIPPLYGDHNLMISKAHKNPPRKVGVAAVGVLPSRRKIHAHAVADFVRDHLRRSARQTQF